MVFDKISRLITRYFTVWLVLCSMLAFFFPDPLKANGGWITNMLGLIMLGMGLTMKFDDFKLVFSRPKDVLVGVILRYTIMPLVGFCVAKILDLPPALAAGLILVGCCPSGTASNVICFLAKGDVALSVTVSSFNILLAPVLLPPTFLLLAGQYVQVDAVGMFLDTVKVVLIPVIAGLLLRRYCGSLVERFMKVIPVLTIIIMIWVIAIVVAVSAAKLATVAGIAFVAVAMHNGTGFALGYGISKAIGMAESKARAICFEVGIEMSGLAVVLAMAHLDPVSRSSGGNFQCVAQSDRRVSGRLLGQTTSCRLTSTLWLTPRKMAGWSAAPISHFQPSAMSEPATADISSCRSITRQPNKLLIVPTSEQAENPRFDSRVFVACSLTAQARPFSRQN